MVEFAFTSNCVYFLKCILNHILGDITELSLRYYILQADANIFLVDWGKGANVPSYPQACSNTRIAGAEVAR